CHTIDVSKNGVPLGTLNVNTGAASGPSAGPAGGWDGGGVWPVTCSVLENWKVGPPSAREVWRTTCGRDDVLVSVTDPCWVEPAAPMRFSWVVDGTSPVLAEWPPSMAWAARTAW